MVRYLVALAAALILSACGGGESSSLSGAGTQKSATAAPAMPATLQAALKQAVPQAALAGAPLGADEALDWAELQLPSYFPKPNKLSGFASPYTYRYYPSTDTYLGVATAADDVAVYVYGAINGWQLIRVGSLTDFTCQIKPQVCKVSATPPAASMTAFEGGVQQLDLDVALPPVPGTLFAPFSPQPVTWLNTQVIGTSTVRITANALNTPAGSYDGEVVLQYLPTVGTLMTKVVPVSFTVGAGLIAPAAQQKTLNATTNLASIAGSVTVARGDGTAQAWSAASSQPWLTVTPGGTTPSLLNYTFEPTAVASLPNFAESTATVTLTSAGVPPAKFQVTLSKQLPYLSTVMPYGIPAGSSTRVVVRGAGFLQYAGAPSISGVPVSDVQVQSDNQIVFKAAPVAAGNYAVRVGNAAAITTAAAALQVTAANPYAASSLATSGEKTVAIHDPVRQAIFAVGGYAENALYKYQYANGAWTATALPLTGPDSIALSPDGSRLFATRQATTAIKEINPDTMTITATYQAPGSVDLNYETALAVSVDNRLWIPGNNLGYLDLVDNTFKNITSSSGAYGSAYVGTDDGDSVLISPDFCCSNVRWYLYKSGDGTVTAPAGDLQLWYRLKVSADGQRILQQSSGELYNGNYDLMGQLPTPVDGEHYGRIAITPDGTRIVALVYTGNFQANYIRIDVFNTASLQSGTVRFVKVGSIPVTQQASACNNGDPYCNTTGVLLPSADNKAVFWLGNQLLQTFKLP